MKIKVKVADTALRNSSGVSKTTGKEFNMNFQENVYIELNGEMRRFPLRIEKGQHPYAAGLYEFDPIPMLALSQYGALVVAPFTSPDLQLLKAA